MLDTECGYISSMANSYINTKTNLKKLQFGTDKCHKMHVGKKKINDVCPKLFVDGWEMKEVTDLETKVIDIEFCGSNLMEEVGEEKYLGDIISQDGRNLKNIMARIVKGNGIITQIMCILDEVFFGKH